MRKCAPELESREPGAMKACKANGLHPRNDESNRKNPHGMALSRPRARHRLSGWPASAERVPLGLSRAMFYDASSLSAPPERICGQSRAANGRESGDAANDRSWNVFAARGACYRREPAAAQDPVAGAIVGGALGGIIGGAVGRGAGGAVAGAVIGAHDRRGDRIGSPAPEWRLLLVARRLLLPLPERRSGCRCSRVIARIEILAAA